MFNRPRYLLHTQSKREKRKKKKQKMDAVCISAKGQQECSLTFYAFLCYIHALHYSCNPNTKFMHFSCIKLLFVVINSTKSPFLYSILLDIVTRCIHMFIIYNNNNKITQKEKLHFTQINDPLYEHFIIWLIF